MDCFFHLLPRPRAVPLLRIALRLDLACETSAIVASRRPETHLVGI
jgi:hypothetical protein